MPSANDPHLDWPLPAGRPGREIWYSLVAHPERDVAVWYRYTLLSTESGHREGRLWFAITDRDTPERSLFATRLVDPGDVAVGADPFLLVLDDSEQTHRGARGSIDAQATKGGPDADVAWRFAYEPDETVFTPVRNTRLMDVLARVADGGKHWSANQSIRMDGAVTVGDEEITFTDAPGHQGHTVSSRPPERVAWVHCNAFPDRDVTLEALNVGGTVSICLRRDDRAHHLNRLRDLVGPWDNTTTAIAPGVWAFRGVGEGVTLEARVEADTDHWQRVAYRAPDDSLRYNAHCSLSHVDLTIQGDDGTRQLSSDRARAEWVTREKGVPGEYRPQWAGRRTPAGDT